MTQYAKIENNKVVSIGRLPKSYKNISNFHLLTKGKLLKYGFKPLEHENQPLSNTQRYGKQTFVIEKDKVIATREILEYDPATYAERRRAEYPDIGDQLDAIMRWAFSETEITLSPVLKSMAAKCMAVKSRFPKPEGEI